MQIDLRRRALIVFGKMLEIHTVIKAIILLDTATSDKRAEALIHKGGKTYEQGVDKLIFVGEIALLVKHVEYTRGGDLVTLYLQNEIGVLCQVLDGFFRNTARQLNGHDLLLVLDKNRGRADDSVQCGQCRLHTRDPFRVDRFADCLTLEGRFHVRRADQHTRLIEVRAFLGKLL